MEYDNDKKIKPAPKIELLFWGILAILYPVINYLTVFPASWKMGLLLLVISLLLLPGYIFYERIIVTHLLFKNKKILFTVVSIAFLVLIQLIISAIFSIISHSFDGQQPYFVYTAGTMIRESCWTAFYLFLCFTIAHILKELEEKEMLIDMGKANESFKLKYLRSQLNPHFLFNTLNSIYSLSLQKSDQAPEVVIKLADIMRYLVDECNEPKVPLSKEINFIKNYLDIERIRHNADIQFVVEGTVTDILVEPFLFISFIENGCKHAFDNAYGQPFVYITLKAYPENIELTVINNTSIDIETQAKKIQGTGIKNSKSLLELVYPGYYALNIIQTEKQPRQSPMRFKNARERLQQLYPDAHTLDVILSNNAFTVSLIIKPGVA